MVTPPFNDTVDKDKRVLTRGQITFLKVRAEAADGSPIAIPEADAFARTDIFTIDDPDSVDVTSDYQTLNLDPADPGDDWNAVKDDAEGKYVGDQAAPPNTGLFWDGEDAVALKVEVPLDAEDTTGDEIRVYTINWKIQIGTDGGGAPIFLTGNETFNVRASGGLAFGDSQVSVNDVKDGFETILSDATIKNLISRAEKRIASLFDKFCGVDILALEPIPSDYDEAVIFYTQYLITLRDTSAGGIPTMEKEGTKQIRYSASSEKLSMGLHDAAITVIRDYCSGTTKRPKMRSFRQAPNDGKWRPTGV